MVKEFRCKADALDISEANIAIAQERAEELRISHLINFSVENIENSEPPENPYELILAEGGLLSFIGRDDGLSQLNSLLEERGWLAFSDLILLTDEVNIPSKILSIFNHNHYCYENEASYREMIEFHGYETHIMTLVPQSGWDNYYSHMVRRLEDTAGFFKDSTVKGHFHNEIDTFYRLEGYRYVGYLFGLIRKK